MLIVLFLLFATIFCGVSEGVINHFYFGFDCIENSLFSYDFSYTEKCFHESWDDTWSGMQFYFPDTQSVLEEQYNEKFCKRQVSSTKHVLGECENYTSEIGNFSEIYDFGKLDLREGEYLHYLFNSNNCNESTIEIVHVEKLERCTYIGGGRRILGECQEDGSVKLSFYYTEGCKGDPPHVEIAACESHGAFTTLYTCKDMT